MFIQLMWQNYQPAIIKWIFAPYCTYMFFFILLASKGAGEFLDALADDVDGKDTKGTDTPALDYVCIVVASIVVFVFWLRFAILEFQ